jgi:chorismate mutase
MAKTLRGLRGATTASANTSEAILEAAAELLRSLQDMNGFAPDDVESAIFTSSPDLTADYPARAARLLGWTAVPLLGAQEVAVPDGLERCIRVLLHLYTAKPQRELKHMYLREASTLRPDRPAGGPAGPEGSAGRGRADT